jgi:hypothetical protein
VITPVRRLFHIAELTRRFDRMLESSHVAGKDSNNENTQDKPERKPASFKVHASHNSRTDVVASKCFLPVAVCSGHLTVLTFFCAGSVLLSCSFQGPSASPKRTHVPPVQHLGKGKPFWQ